MMLRLCWQCVGKALSLLQPGNIRLQQIGIQLIKQKEAKQ
jgi:hypothetical protein